MSPKKLSRIFSSCRCDDESVYEKPKSRLRWLVLVFACLMLIGSYYCYDIPAACKTQLGAYMGFTSEYETYFGLLYTLYAVPNVILPFFGGYFVDKFGVRLCLLIFAALVAIGQVVFSFGLSIKSWPCMFLGRFIFGLGGESLVVANSALLADWFKGKELAFAFGINLSIARLGSVINNVVSPSLTQSAGLLFAMWFGAMTCAGSVACVVFTMPIDKSMDDKLKWHTTPYLGDHDSDIGYSNLLEPALMEAHNSSESCISSYIIGHSLNIDVNKNENDKSEFMDSAQIFKHENPGSMKSSLTPTPTPERRPSNEVISGFNDIFKLSHIFWILSILCFVVYGCVLPFNNIASSFLLERDYFIAPPEYCALESFGCQSSTNLPNSYCPASSSYQPPLPYNVTLSDGTIYPGQVTMDDVDCTQSVWQDDCTVEYCTRLNDGLTQSAVIMSIPYIISAALSPVLGFFIDKYGLRALISALSPLLIIIIQCILAFTTVSPVGPMVGQGIAYTGFAAALWPSVPLVVDERLTGLGFGVVTSMLNTACAVVPLLVAAVFTDAGGKYIPNAEVIFISLAVIGLLAGIYLNIYDFNHGSILNSGEYWETPQDKIDEFGEGKKYNAPHIAGVVTNNPITYSPIYSHGGSADDMHDNVVFENDVNDSNDFNSREDGPAHGHGRRAPVVSSSPESSNSAAARAHSTSGFDSSYGFTHRQRQRISSLNGGPSFPELRERKRGTSFTAYEEVYRGGAY